jgi:hypothetical protein
MVTSVAYHRLERLKVQGRYTETWIRQNDLQLVRKAVLHALGMESWQEVVEVVVKAKVTEVS